MCGHSAVRRLGSSSSGARRGGRGKICGRTLGMAAYGSDGAHSCRVRGAWAEEEWSNGVHQRRIAAGRTRYGIGGMSARGVVRALLLHVQLWDRDDDERRAGG
jgi:hypothetical protein